MHEPAPYDAVVERLRSAGCVFAEDEARLLVDTATTAHDLAEKTQRRAAGVPLEHVLGWAEFGGLHIAVAPGVFVPRQRTRFLAERAIECARSIRNGERLTVVELCCGCGAVGALMAARVGQPLDLHAVDIDAAAIACARRNLAGAPARLYLGDLFQPLPGTLRGQVHIIIANAPYVPTGAIAMMPPEARDHEPRIALDGGPDGLDVLRRIVSEAGGWLAPNGHLLVECASAQAPALIAAAAAAGLRAHAITSDGDETTVLSATPRVR